MKKVIMFVLVGFLLVIGSLFAREFNAEKAVYYSQFKEALAAFEAGQPLNTEQEAMLLEEGIMGNDRELDEQGGPDGYGYYYIDSQEEGGPVYDWIDITETGTMIANMGDDSFQGPFDLGFTFNFYGNDYDQVYICSNGYLMFGGGSNDLSNDQIPNANNPNNIVCFFWDDLNPEDGDSGPIYYGDDGEGNWVCTFDDVAEYWEGGHITCQTILYPGGSIVMQYAALDDNIDIDGETIGIENSNGTDGLQVSYNATPADYPFNELAILFYLNASVEGNVWEAGVWDPVVGAEVNFGDYMAVTDDLGHYVIDEMLPGTYDVLITVEGYPDFTQEGVEILPGENNYDFNIEGYGTLTGVVTDADTEEVIEGAQVTVMDEGGETVAETVTDDQGVYNVEELLPGLYDIEVISARYETAIVPGVEIVGLFETVQDFQLTLMEPSTIEQVQTLAEVGARVYITGIVTQPTNSTTLERTEFYIQDESGYGMFVYDDPPTPPENNINRGDEINVWGTVGLYGAFNTRIYLEDHEVITTGNPIPEPVFYTTGELLAENVMNGLWAFIRGELQIDPMPGSDYYLFIDDDTGEAWAMIWSETGIDLTEYSQGDWISIAGVIVVTDDLQGFILPSMQEDIGYRPDLPMPSGLIADLEQESGEVTLNWSYYLGGAGEPIPGNIESELDEFIEFMVYRDDDAIGTTTDLTYTDQLENYGTYNYMVTAMFQEGESDPAGPVEVQWVEEYVAGRDFAGVPLEWSIAAVYPNPFNPVVKVVVAVPQEGMVRAEVFDIVGRHVAVLSEERMQPGYHALNWRANGPSGIYFLKISAEHGWTGIHKLIFMK